MRAVVLAIAVSVISPFQSPLAERRLPANGGLSITLPVVGNAAVELAERALVTSGTPFGIEKAPLSPTDMATRIDAPIADQISFDGLTLREALNRLVALDPRYAWYEVDGRIIVRTVSLEQPDGALQRRVEPLTINSPGAANAAETLARALVPSRPPGGVAVLGASVTAAGRSASPGAAAPAVVVPGSTLFEALNATSSALDGSWIVSYDEPGAAPEATSISIVTRAATAVALSPTAMARARPIAPGRLVIPVTGDLGTVVTWFGLRTKTQTGFIRVPGERRDARMGSFAPLDLTGLKTGEALDRIVALDGRYEWTRDDGIVLVRPRRELVDGTPLDMPVDAFAARGIGVDAILARIIRLLAVEGAGGGSAGERWSGGPEERERQRLARQRPLTFSARRTTVRGVLNELCKEEGTLSWRASLQPDLQRGLLVTLSLDSFDGWGVSRTFVAPPWEPAEPRAPSPERRAPSAEPRAPSAEPRAPSAESLRYTGPSSNREVRSWLRRRKMSPASAGAHS